MVEFLCKESLKIHIHIDCIDKKDILEEQVHVRRWFHEHFEIKDKLLIEFSDSLDPERRNKIPGKSIQSKLNLKKTLPSLLILSGLTADLLMTKVGRKLCMKTWVYGTLIDCLWVSIRVKDSLQAVGYATMLWVAALTSHWFLNLVISVNKTLLIEHCIK